MMIFHPRRLPFLMSHVYLLVAVFITFAITSGYPSLAQTSIALTGHVTNALTGEPLPNCVVILVDEFGLSWQSLSDADGVYTFSDIPAGIYLVDTELRGYALTELLDVTLEETATTVQNLLLAGMTTIVGQVFASDGVTPLANIPLLATGTDEGNLFAAVTDADGFYSFNEMQPDSYIVEPISVDYGFEPRDAGVISRGTPLFGFDFAAVAYSTISGQVFEFDGVTSIPEAAVLVVREDGELFSSIADADGVYIVDQITGMGPFTVQAFSETAMSSKVEVEIANVESVLTGVDLVAVEEEAPLVVPDISGTGMIVGRVVTSDTQTPIEGIMISIALIMSEDENGGPDIYPLLIDEPPIVTDAHGTFTISGIAAGRYQILAEHPDALEILMAVDEDDETGFDAALLRVMNIVEVEVATEGDTLVELSLVP